MELQWRSSIIVEKINLQVGWRHCNDGMFVPEQEAVEELRDERRCKHTM